MQTTTFHRSGWFPSVRAAHARYVAPSLLALLLAAASLSPPRALAVTEGETQRYQLMAVFLYNFLSFVEWPADARLDEGPLRIGIAGANPFGEAIQAIEKKTVNNRPIRFIVYEGAGIPEPVHILFVTKERAGDWTALRQAAAGQAVLTVGETEDFTRKGGVIRFFEVATAEGGRQLRVEVNEAAAQAQRLQIRSKLLRLATLVNYPPPPE